MDRIQDNPSDQWQHHLAGNWTVASLKAAIVTWSIIIIIVVLFFVHDPWILAGILLYEILP